MAEIIYDEKRDVWAYRQMLRSPYIDYFNGRFFVTFQVAHNKSALGVIVGESCVLNELGEAVKAAWLAEPQHVAGLEIFDFVVMPNHFHAIVEYHGPAATGLSAGGDRPTAGGRCESPPPSKYTRPADARDLPYVIGLFKSYTTTLYHRLKAAGRCVDIGPTLWQPSFYDELIRSEEQYRATAHYILRNPANWNSDRFGAVTSFAEGNLGLLQSEYIAYMSSEGSSFGDRPTAGGRFPATLYFSRADTSAGRSGPAATKRSGPAATGRSSPAATGRSGPAATGRSGPAATGRYPIISTFTSYYERQVLARCLATGRRFVWVLPGGISAAALAQTASARAAGNALLISPVAPDTGVNKQRAIWCNQFIAKNAHEIWIGHLRPGGSLETILKATVSRQ